MERLGRTLIEASRNGAFSLLSDHLPICFLDAVHILPACAPEQAVVTDRIADDAAVGPAVLSTCLGEPLRRLIGEWWSSALDYADRQPSRRKRGLMRNGGPYSRIGQKGGNEYELDRFDPSHTYDRYERSDARLR